MRRSNDHRDEAREEAGQQVAGDEAAHRPVDPRAHPSQNGLAPLGHQRDQALAPLAPFEQHEQGQECDHHDPEDARRHALEDADRGAGRAGEGRRSPAREGGADPLDDVVVTLEEPQRPVAAAQVRHQARDGVDELGDLHDQRRDEDQPENGHDDDGQAEDGGHRTPAREAHALEAVHRRVEGEREEQRDRDQGQRGLREEEEGDRGGGQEQDSQGGQQRARADHEDALRRLGAPGAARARGNRRGRAHEAMFSVLPGCPGASWAGHGGAIR